MKKIITTFLMLWCLIGSAQAMSDSRIRESARFLSDRMAYELQLTTMQYEDCYEINYDFLYSINSIMDDVVYGYSDAIEAYYNYLDWRNDDISMVLNRSQFERFMALEYFYRPIYTSGRNWLLRIYQIYTNHSYFYFGLPTIYHTYHGIHSRHHHSVGFYGGRYHHDHYYDHHGHHFHGSQHFDHHRRSDFGDRYHHRDNGHLRRPEPHRGNVPGHNNRRDHHDNHGVGHDRNDRNHGVERHQHHQQSGNNNRHEQHGQGNNNRREQHGQGNNNRREQHGQGNNNHREQHGQGNGRHERGPVAERSQQHRSSVSPQREHHAVSSSNVRTNSNAGHSLSNSVSSTRPSSNRVGHSGASRSHSEGGRNHERGGRR